MCRRCRLDPGKDSVSEVFLSNYTGFTQNLDADEFLGVAVPAEVVDPSNSADVSAFAVTNATAEEASEKEQCRQKKLLESLEEPHLLHVEKDTLLRFLEGYHHVFSLDEGERSKTNLVQMEINTGNAPPRKQPPRRILFAL